MLKKHIPFFAVVCLLVCAAQSVVAQTKTITLGGKNGWSNLSVMDSVEFGTGRFGYESVLLSNDEHRVTSETDLLISFEDGNIVDVTGNYSVAVNNLDISNKTIMGSSAGLSRGKEMGLRLHGSKNSIFGGAGLTGSFVIEFWLCPSIAESGEQFFNWRSSRNVGDSPLYQDIRASFFNNHVEWVFNNIFGAGNKVESEVIITSTDSIIPRKWAHHQITYDDESGLIEYRIDGKIQAVRYVTSTKRESGEVYNARLGVPADIEFCTKYSGLIDEICISRTARSSTLHDFYARKGGRFESQPLASSGFNSALTGLEAIYSTPRETDVAFYVRGGDNFYEWTDEYPEWVPVVPGTQIRGVSGRYFQLAAELYPDGNGGETPSVSEVVLTYNETTPPLPPATIKATAGNGVVDLYWTSSVDFSVGGYIIYYGEHPGEYLGSVAVEGASPIDVGDTLSYRLTGLKNGNIYYFAVAAYSSLDKRIVGVLSKEVYARPLRKVK
ncbi:MAG: fibronectin type III domain-containing protein [Spirochaetaceae bacterium]|nr:fibronectin type III domain-containing protein [Spirochaetaceae bacterium]